MHANHQEVTESVSTGEIAAAVGLKETKTGDTLCTEKNVVKETRKQLGKMQKEVFLREQMKSIEKELGMDGEKGEIDILKAKIKSVGMPKETEVKALDD